MSSERASLYSPHHRIEKYINADKYISHNPVVSVLCRTHMKVGSGDIEIDCLISVGLWNPWATKAR